MEQGTDVEDVDLERLEVLVGEVAHADYQLEAGHQGAYGGQGFLEEH